MSSDSSHRITRLLAQIRGGNKQAAEELVPLVYEELRRLARARMARETPKFLGLLRHALQRRVHDHGDRHRDRAGEDLLQPERQPRERRRHLGVLRVEEIRQPFHERSIAVKRPQSQASRTFPPSARLCHGLRLPGALFLVLAH